jgi:hypothetical protein
MSTKMAEVNYYELDPDFSEIYLEDSYVVGLNETSNSIEFLMDLALREKHPFYIPPKADEQYCFKKGKIIFPDVKNITWKEKSFMPSKDADGEIDYGNIDSFVFENGKYNLTGGWGEVLIESGTPKIIF